MSLTKQPLALVLVVVATLGLASCAHEDEFAKINTRLDQLDTKVQGAAQSADAANQAAQQANQSAQQANQRLDQIESRVQALETAPRRKPRG